MVGDDRALMRVEEAAAMLAISRARAYSLVQSGVIPSIRLGRSLRVPVRQLREWVEQQLVEPAPVPTLAADARGEAAVARDIVDGTLVAPGRSA
jgi:excisionase family DNA binding protein